MSEPLEHILSVHARLCEQYIKGPELYAVSYPDYATLRRREDFVPGGAMHHDLFGQVGPSIVPDQFVARGTAEAWDSAAHYRKHYEARRRLLNWRNN